MAMKKIILLSLVFVYTAQILSAQKYNQIRWQNKPRNYIVYLPKNFNASENLPLVINKHGFLTTSQFQMDYSQFNKFADSVRSIVIYPEGVDLRWNSGTFFFVSSDVDDVGFLSDLMDRAAVLYNADMKKVFATGYSAGGFMCYKLACDLTNRVAAIAPNVASMVFDNLNSCVPARPVNMAAFNGLSDPVTTYNGIPLNFPSIDSVKHFWQIKNNCNVLPMVDTLPDIRNDGTRVVRYTYQNCDDNAEQVFYKVINGGHVWPGANDIFFGILGKTTQDISMNSVAWNFFKTKEVPANVRCDAPSNLQATVITNDSFVVSWSPVVGVAKYKIAIADDSDRVTFYETSNTSLGIKINNSTRLYRWNVASLCASGYHNWNSTRNLNNIITSVKTNSIQTITIYPNPAKDYILLDLPKNRSSNLSVSIFNVLGEEVLKTNTIPENNSIDISQLPVGMYQLTSLFNDNNFVTTFIKE
jgi:polyhydroxybutyrate depolymerase